MAGEGAGRGGDVVRCFEVVEEAGDGRGGEGCAETDSGHAKGFGEGLHDDEIWVLGYELGDGGAVGGEVDVGFVDDDDAVPGWVGEEADDVFFR